jgi:hypothetical protein
MKKAHSFSQVLAIGFATGAIILSSAMPMRAQSTNDKEIDLSGLSSHVSETTSLKHHALPANTPVSRAQHGETSNLHTVSPAANAATAGLESSVRYTGDLSYQGGSVVEYAQSHAIYLYSTSAGCTTPACWGRPATFLQRLGESDFIHVVDQYIGNSADDRYTVGGGFFGFLPAASPTAPLVDADMAFIAHEAAQAAGQTGYGHIFHIFLPPGQDECFDAPSGVCYSPDVPATFFFCAYHTSADFLDGTHVLYTVEPYQNVSGCNVQPGTPNGELVDSTMNSLSHETFEGSSAYLVILR